MDKNKIKNNMIAVYNSLNKLEVKGLQNIELLYGILGVLTQTIQELNTEETEELKKEKEE